MVASIAKGDEDFANALNDPLYIRIREAVLSDGKSKRYLDTHGEELTVPTQDLPRKGDVKVIANGHVNGSSHHDKPSDEIEEEDIQETPDIKCETVPGLGDVFKAEDQKALQSGHVSGHPIQCTPATEIQEEIEEIKNTADGCKVNNVRDRKEDIISTDHLQLENLLKKVQLSPEVEHALGTLDKMIAIVREGKLKAQGSDQSSPETEGNKAKKSAVENHMKLGDKLRISTEDVPGSAAHPPKNGYLVGVLR